jgi:hypothetical protein
MRDWRFAEWFAAAVMATITGLIAFCLVMLGYAIHLEVTNPCVKWKQESCTTVIYVGDVPVFVDDVCSVCVERRDK